MSKADELRKLYNKLELDTTEDRKLLSKVKNREASEQEVNNLFDLINSKKNGGKVLDQIKNHENNLVTDVNKHLDALEEMINESNDVAHCEDEREKTQRYEEIKKRYKGQVKKAEEIIEASKIAYFQINDFTQYENRLYDIRQELSYFE
jgi:hypothetical protein